MNLHRFTCHPFRRLAGDELDQARVQLAVPGVHAAGGGVGELLTGGDGGLHPGKLLQGQWVARHRMIEHHPLFGIFKGAVEGRAHQTARPGRGLQSTARESPHGVVEAPAPPAGLAHQRVVGDDESVEEELEGVHAAVADRRNGAPRQPTA